MPYPVLHEPVTGEAFAHEAEIIDAGWGYRIAQRAEGKDGNPLWLCVHYELDIRDGTGATFRARVSESVYLDGAVGRTLIENAGLENPGDLAGKTVVLYHRWSRPQVGNIYKIDVVG